MAKLLALRDAITSVYAGEPIRVVLLACLSSIAKASSYLDEDQIKVRFAADKNLADPFERFREVAPVVVETQRQLAGVSAGCRRSWSFCWL